MLAEQQTAITTRGIPVSIVPSAEETPVQSLARQLETYRAINTLIDMTFVEGEDYGMIKGVEGYSLRVPGIEKACGLLGLRDEYHDIEVVRDYSPTAPFFYYEVECVLVSIVTGQEVARGQGVCHTREKSFTRTAARKCPKCSSTTIFRSKNEGEGWYCWKKEGGCGAQFTEKDPAIISQEVGNVIDVQQVWDGINRARKVANKRAISSAIRRVAMLSGKFVKRLSNGTTEIRYTPAEVKQMTALSRTTTTITGIPSAEQSKESMGSGGNRRVDPPKPEPATPETELDMRGIPTAIEVPEEILTAPAWYTNANLILLLNQVKENGLLKGGVWGDLLRWVGMTEQDCYKFQKGQQLYDHMKPLLEAKKQGQLPAVKHPEPVIDEPGAADDYRLPTGGASPFAPSTDTSAGDTGSVNGSDTNDDIPSSVTSPHYHKKRPNGAANTMLIDMPIGGD